jgi:hypothetical protein
MLVLIGIIVGLFVLLAGGTWLSNRFGKKKQSQVEETPPVEIPMDCCGAHEVCDYEEMLKNPEEIVYFEDEELDRFHGIAADRYQDEQIDEFRDVLYTLQSEEIRKWLLSIERRKIQLPLVLKQEAVQLLSEA